jgi:HTH-type transcriptional regulator/antitoxin MqsA
MTMKCPCCGSAELVHETRDLSYSFKGQQGVAPSVTGNFCPVCGDVVLDAAQGDRLNAWMGEFQKQVNTQRFEPT